MSLSFETNLEARSLKLFTMFLTFSDFIGRFHPVLVHLPIGILLLGCFFQLLSFNKRFSFLRPAVPMIMLWGMLGAVVSAITGYFLWISGDYDGPIVDRHKWLGIIVALLSFILYMLFKMPVGERARSWASSVLIVMIIITGHLGGSLTHGENFLMEGLNNSEKETGPVLKAIPNIQEAAVYPEMVQPILQSRCYGCHGPNKRKGKLRLDSPDFILKGGEEEAGKAVVPGKPEESELVRRISLPLEHEDHMAPKQKPQLTQNEIALLRWWVSTGADFTKKVKDLDQSAEIRPVLQAMESGTSTLEIKLTDIPMEPVKAASLSDVERLRNAGIIIITVAQNSNYLSANFVTARGNPDSLMNLLVPLSKQLVWLKLDAAAITDTAMEALSKLVRLTRLQLSNTRITDKGLARLRTLEELQSLNLVGTNVTAEGVMQLRNLEKLKNLYLYQAKIEKGEWPVLQKAFPETTIDSGRYFVPILPTDTIEVRY